MAVHRQCRDDRLGRGGAFRRWRERPARRPRAGPLAAGRERGAGARGGGQGMKLGIIGGGAWGTALAQVAAAGGRETLLWALEAEVVDSINTTHENNSFLPGVPLDPAIRATLEIDDLDVCEAWLVVTPAQHMRATLASAPAGDRPLITSPQGTR